MHVCTFLQSDETILKWKCLSMITSRAASPQSFNYRQFGLCTLSLQRIQFWGDHHWWRKSWWNIRGSQTTTAYLRQRAYCMSYYLIDCLFVMCCCYCQKCSIGLFLSRHDCCNNSRVLQVQSNLSKWTLLKWITHLNGYIFSGPI